jgi:hypothetical protein
MRSSIGRSGFRGPTDEGELDCCHVVALRKGSDGETRNKINGIEVT